MQQHDEYVLQEVGEATVENVVPYLAEWLWEGESFFRNLPRILEEEDDKFSGFELVMSKHEGMGRRSKQ